MSKRVNFTQELLISAKPTKQGARIVLWDKKVSGLVCRVTYSGTKTFSVHRRINNGRLERITLGKFPQITIEQARKMAMMINASIAMGDNPAQIKRAHKAELNFEELFIEYTQKYACEKKKSWGDDQSRFNKYLKAPIGSKKLSQIDRMDITHIHHKISKIKVITAMGEKDRGITANRVVVLVSAVFNWGIKNGLCKENPARGISKNKERSRDRFLQPEELSGFFKAVENEPNEIIRDYVWLSLYTGARRSNVVSMRWEDISLHNKIWRIPTTKNGDPVIIPLIKEAVDILKQRYNNGSQFVFPSESDCGHLIDPKKGWKRILERAEIKDLRLHDLRRTLGSWQAIMGSSTIIIGKSLGHKSQQATAVYARLNIDPVRKSLEAATSAMFAAAKEQ